MGKQIWKPGNMLYPLPVVLVSVRGKERGDNIITVAWTGTVNTNPPMVSVSVRPERYSHSMIKESGEFIINLVSKNLIKAADYCGVKSGRDVDKFQEMKLTKGKADKVDVPLICESPVNVECRVADCRKLGSHDMFLAEIVAVHVEDSYLDKNGKFHLNRAGLVTYSHGEYFLLGEKLGSFGYSVQKKKRKK